MEGSGNTWVVVTGASSGIGRATALALGRAGFRVLGGVRSDEDAEALAAEGDGGVMPVRLDITVARDVRGLVGIVEERCGAPGLAGLVNNAGVAVAGPLEFLPLDDLRHQFEVNVVGQVAVTQALLPALRRARDAGGRARIVFVGSISGMIGSRLLGAYSASKFALEAIDDVFRRELEPWGLQVSLIEPGRVATPIWKKSRDAGRARVPRMSGRVEEFYAEAIDGVLRGAGGADGDGAPPEAVARAVVHALRSARPRTRYRVGSDARMVAALVRRLPDRWVDRLLVWTRR